MAKKTKSFSVSAIVKVWTNCKVDAENLEDAVAKARELTVHDFVKITEDHIDSKFRITGVDSNDWDSVDE